MATMDTGRSRSLILGDGGLVATTEGIGLRASWGGPYYQKVNITLDWNIWATGERSGINTDVVTLLHEIGHAINLLAAGVGAQNSFAGDAYSDDASRKNNDMVWSNRVR
jgi:hypothetical protein